MDYGYSTKFTIAGSSETAACDFWDTLYGAASPALSTVIYETIERVEKLDAIESLSLLGKSTVLQNAQQTCPLYPMGISNANPY